MRSSSATVNATGDDQSPTAIDRVGNPATNRASMPL